MMHRVTQLQQLITRHQRPWWWLALGVIIALWFTAAMWNQYFRDTLTPNVPNDAVAYVRVSLPKLAPSGRLVATLQATMTESGISIPPSLVRREVGFFALESQGQLQWYALARVDRPRTLAKQLGDRVMRAPHGVLIIPLSPDVAPLSADYAHGDWSRTSGARVGWRDTVFMYISPTAVRGQAEFVGLAPIIQGTNRPLVLHGRLSRDGALVFGRLTHDRPDPAYDLVVMTNATHRLATAEGPEWYGAWSQAVHGAWLTQYGIDLSVLADPQFDQISITARHNNRQTGWYLADYDWHAAATGPDLDQVTSKLQHSISTAVAYELPSRRSRPLDDQSALIERVPVPENWQFVATSTAERLALLEISDRELVIRSLQEDSRSTITNSQLELPAGSGPRLQVSVDLMGGGMWRYLRGFSAILATDGSLIIK